MGNIKRSIIICNRGDSFLFNTLSIYTISNLGMG